MRSCWTSAAREAPIAMRMAISFVRAVPRPSNRFATLAQAISKTNPVIPSSVSDKVASVGLFSKRART